MGVDMKKYINVLDYEDYNKLNSSMIQNAINACENGVVFFPKRTYVLSTIFLKSNITIIFEQGTKILGSLNFDDYERDEQFDNQMYQDASHTFFHSSMFAGINVENVKIIGKATIDMRSIWDEKNVRNMAHRGPKCFAFKNAKNVEIRDLTIINATDIAVYFAGSENIKCNSLKLRVHIDGITYDNCKNSVISNCNLVTGDDGIVFKSTYNLNKLDICRNIEVLNNKIKSRCNAIKFGTETIGGFYNFQISDSYIYDTRIAGIAIESVDGAHINNIIIDRTRMVNVNCPVFIHLGNRLRGPANLKIGSIENVVISNLTAKGPYKAYKTIAWNYNSYKMHDTHQLPWKFGKAESIDETNSNMNKKSCWQMTSNICGLKENHLKNILLKNIEMVLDGGYQDIIKDALDDCGGYPECYVYGRFLPAKGIFFRYVDGLRMIHCSVKTLKKDFRKEFIFIDCKQHFEKTNLPIK